jgi:hypothetical protein
MKNASFAQPMQSLGGRRSSGRTDDGCWKEMAANLTGGKTLLIFVTTSTCCPIACREFLETLSESCISFCYSLNVSIDSCYNMQPSLHVPLSFFH